MQKDTIFILAVALITWGGVLAHLIRLEGLVRALEEKLRGKTTDLHETAARRLES